MEVPVLRLGADDLWRALEEIDPVDLRLAQLTDPVAGHDGFQAAGAGDGDLVLLADAHNATRCVVSRSSLRLCRSAMMTTLAARELLTAGETTVALLASGETANFHLAMLACHVPGVGHVCLTSAGDGEPAALDERVLELLDRAGIELSVVDTVDEAVLGANLLITTGPGHDDLSHKHLTRGALLVNVAGHDLPADIVDRVDQIYVDDFGLLHHNRHRRFVTVHLGAGGHDRPAPLLEPEGWHHKRDTWHQLRRVEADIRQVISGHNPGRTHLDDVLLFELLGIRELDAALAAQIHRTARERGLGTWISDRSHLAN